MYHALKLMRKEMYKDSRSLVVFNAQIQFSGIQHYHHFYLVIPFERAGGMYKNYDNHKEMRLKKELKDLNLFFLWAVHSFLRGKTDRKTLKSVTFPQKSGSTVTTSHFQSELSKFPPQKVGICGPLWVQIRMVGHWWEFGLRDQAMCDNPSIIPWVKLR